MRDKSKVRANQIRWRAKHSEHVRAYRLAHRKENAERMRRRRQAHLEEERARDKRYREAHKQERNERSRLYQQTHRKEVHEYHRKYYRTHKEMSWERQLKRKFRISKTEYLALLESQGGVCAICGAPPNGKMFAVDHDHSTGEVRGLLCDSDNKMLGFAKDSLEILEKAAHYLLTRQRKAANI